MIDCMTKQTDDWLHKRTNVPTVGCTTISLHKRTNVPTVGCTNVSLHKRTNG